VAPGIIDTFQVVKSLMVEIRGSDLPGRRCGPTPEGGTYENVHVGLKRRTETIDLVPGDAESVRWEFEISMREIDDGEIDFGGPFVHGRRGERALGLSWGTVAEDVLSTCSGRPNCGCPTWTPRSCGRR
jgi:hypothetical protein